MPLAEAANFVPPREGTHLVGAPGEPPFAPGSSNFPTGISGINYPPVSFFKDRDDVVHIDGAAAVGESSVIFVLPPGFRPASQTLERFDTLGAEGTVIALGSNVVLEGKDYSGAVIASKEALLSGISFRAGS